MKDFHLLIVGLVAALHCPTAGYAQGVLAIRGARIETVGKQGAIENGTILIKNGKIESIGTDIAIPVSAQIVDARGKTIIPGLVDPYYVVQIGRSAQASETRTVVFQGRTITIGGGSPATSTSFAKIADGIDMSQIDWAPSRRSGITTLHVVTGGFAQSLIAQNSGDKATISKPDGQLLVTVTNETRSLNILRNGLKVESPRGSSSSSSAAALAAARSGFRGSRPTPSGSPPPSSSNTSAPTGGTTSTEAPKPTDVWAAAKEGKEFVFVNVNNAASILHSIAATKETKAAKLIFVASGSDVYQTLDELNGKSHSLIMSPTIDIIPSSANRINVAKMLSEKDITFAFSQTLGQSDFRDQQDNPLFSVAMLVRAGLDRNKALAALTITPAKMIGADSEVGTLETGKKANFLVLDGDPFATTTGIEKVYIDGKPVHAN